MPDDAREQPDVKPICTFCSRENEPSALYCRHCGHSLSAADPYQLGPYTAPLGDADPDDESR